jgi:hypothetical protein
MCPGIDPDQARSRKRRKVDSRPLLLPEVDSHGRRLSEK